MSIARFENLNSVVHQGITISFGTQEVNGAPALFYNVLGLNVESEEDSNDWTGFKQLALPVCVRPAGMSLVSLPLEVAGVAADPALPIRVVSDQRRISVLIPSTRGTVLLARYLLRKVSSGGRDQSSDYELSPVWEVRFERSGKQSVADDRTDPQTYVTADGKPFLEPMYELAMLNGFANRQFDVLFLPVQDSEALNWQFITTDASTGTLSLFNFPSTDTGLPDTAGKTLNDSFEIPPDATFTVVDETNTPLDLQFGPRATLYMKHENAIGPDGDSMTVRREGRVALALPAAQDSKTVTIIADIAVSRTGTLADISGEVSASRIEPANYALAFDDVAYIGLNGGTDAPLEIKGAYRFDLWVNPSEIGNSDRMILGGAAGVAAEARAPFLNITRDLRLAFGFGNGSAEQRYVTEPITWQVGAWYHLELTFTPGAEKPFTVEVNGSALPAAGPEDPGLPTGSALARISAASGGFNGQVDAVVIEVDGTIVADLPFDTVDYEKTPRTTPNSAASGVIAEVFGTRLELSSSPLDLNTNGTFNIDEDGLTWYAGYAPFLMPAATPDFLEGSDAILHLYFQDESTGIFSVGHYSTRTQRAIFGLPWTTAQLVPQGVEEENQLRIVSHAPGTAMNSAEIRVDDGPDLRLCDVELANVATDHGEEWRGMPRMMRNFSTVLNGQATNDPSNQDLLNGARLFFDYSGTYPQIVVRSSVPGDGGLFQFVSRLPTIAPLAALKIEDGTRGGDANLTVENTPTHWSTGTIRHTWPNVGRIPSELTQTLAGTRAGYDYSAVGSNTDLYGLEATIGLASVTNAAVFVRRSELPNFDLEIMDGDSGRLSTVQVNDFQLQNVPRDQVKFAHILNGLDASYTYPEGYKEAIAANILVQTSGLAAEMRNTGGKAAGKAPALAFSNLNRAFYDGTPYDAGALDNLERTDAGILQQARGGIGEKRAPIAGSALVSAAFEAPPTSGATAGIVNTAANSGGIAPLLVNGAVGGWIQNAPNFSVGTNKNGKRNYLAYGFAPEEEMPPIEALSIDGDMSVEVWLNPTDPVSALHSRLMTFHSVGNISYPALPFRYMLGLKQGPAVEISNGAFAARSYNFLPPNATLQLYINITSEEEAGTFASINPVRGVGDYLKLRLAQFSRPVVEFMGEDVIATGKALPLNQWVLLTVTVQPGAGGGTDISFYINDEAPVTGSSAQTYEGQLGELLLGARAQQPLTFLANGVSMWRVSLTAEEVRSTYLYDYADNATGLLIRWNCTEGTGSTLLNAAASGDNFDATISNFQEAGWDDDGIYQVPYAGRNDLVFEAGGIARNWTHVAMLSRQGRGITLDGSAYGIVDDGSDLNGAESYSLEISVLPDASETSRVLIEKPGCYRLMLDSLNRIQFTTVIRVGLQVIAFTATSTPLSINASHSIACTFTSGAVENSGTEGRVLPQYFASAQVYVDGQASGDPAFADTYADSVQVQASDSAFQLGRNAREDFFYTGKIANIRLWQRALTEAEIAEVAVYHKAPARTDGLAADWPLRETEGRTAFDQQGNSNLRMSSNQLWSLYEEVAQMEVLVDGRDVPLSPLNADDLGGYGDRQLTVGASINQKSPNVPFDGSIDELRIWDGLLTPEQVTDSMNRTLDPRTDGLAGYWRFNTGSGLQVYDQTGRGSTLSFSPANETSGPDWETSTAPISEEAAPVLNVLGGVKTEFTGELTGTAAVCEYSDTQLDAYGTAFAVLKRAYVYNPGADGDTRLLTGYKVGDLDLIYIGQVQTAPKITGYIEGGPPIPSENQTVPYWAGPPGTSNPFGSASSVTLSEARNTTWSFSASQNIGGSFEIGGSLGLLFKGKFDNSNGQFTFFGMDLAEYEAKAGAKLGLTASKSGDSGIGRQHGLTHARTSELAPAGSWEPADDMLNPKVGRRYVQDNIGTAFVKSSTANLYMTAIKGSQTAVAYTLIADPTIPEDVNIIDFPINPRYVKNGTLDGKVGFVNDPDWPDADVRRGSYFNPTEAYALKRRFEKQEQDAQAYYDQFNVDLLSLYPLLSPIQDKMDNAPGFDRGTGTIQRNLANTYVWSAGGGLLKEEYSTVDQFSESRSGVTSLTLKAGVEVEGKATSPAGGFYGTFDAMLSTTFTTTVSKNSATSYAVALSASANPTGFLNAPIISIEDGKPVLHGYTDGPAPGKVDTYRYMSFFLAPSKANFSQLARVIDPNWLNNSAQANAAALREASEAENGTWRILYRTTFVSRVPMEFQPINSDTLAPDVEPPANVALNSWLLDIFVAELDATNPTPVEIGDAVSAVLGTGPDQPGILAVLLPWWTAFLTRAEVFGSEDYKALVTLREDLLQYVIRFYESAEALS